MKKTIAPLIALAITFIAVSCGSKKDPVEYNNEVITVINGSEKHITAMNSAMTSRDYDKATEIQKEWNDAIDADIKKMEEIGDFNGDDNLQQAVLTGLKGYKKIVEEDYPKLIDIRKNNTEDPTTESQLLDNINQAFEDMAKGVNAASDKFEKDYARKP